MSAAEIEEARKAIKRLAMPEDKRRTRRFAPGGRPARIDARRSFRRSLQPGGVIDLEFRSPIDRAPPVVALCDISGSMNEYTRLFLHFLHALGETRRVSTFLFGTRLTNVTRAMRARDPDDALARCSAHGGRLVRRHPDRRGAAPLQPGLVAARARSRRDHAPHHRRARARQPRQARGRDGAARQIEPARDLGQPAAALWRLCRQGGGDSSHAALRRIRSVRSTISPAWPIFARRCRAVGDSSDNPKARLLAVD